MRPSTTAPAGKPTLGIEAGRNGTLRVVLAGSWRMHEGVPEAAAAVRAVVERSPARVEFEAARLSAWDGSLLALAERVGEACAVRGIPVDRSALPAGARRLLERGDRPPEREAPAPVAPAPFLVRIGARAQAAG